MKQNKTNKQKKNSITTNILNKVPYISCFDDLGMIEIEPNKYSICFRIDTPTQYDAQYVSKTAYKCMGQLFKDLQGFTCRFTIRNSIIPVEQYLNSIMLPETKEDHINTVIHDYNKVLQDNVSIGHNNFCGSLYLTVITSAEVPDDALQSFEAIVPKITDIFREMYGYQAQLLSMGERLEIVHDLYNPECDENPFGSKFGLSVNDINVANLTAKKIKTKALVAPSLFESSHRNYMRIGNKYVRMFFINAIPAHVTDSLLCDLISISSDSLLSVTYQFIDTEFGYNAAGRKVSENIEIKAVPVRDTIEDRRTRRVDRREILIAENEEEYFNRAALSLFNAAHEKGEPVVLATFVVGLYSDSLEDLDRDTGLLNLSAAKYSCQIKPCDLQQEDAFVSALPLGSTRIDIIRTFNIDRISKLLPINIQSLFEDKVLLQGLNEINDNYVLIDRANYPIGLITGTKTSGKTFALKRDVINTLISTDDTVVILAPKPSESGTNDYEKLIKTVQADVLDPVMTDLFTCDSNYSLTGDNRSFRTMFLESFITLRTGFYRGKFSSQELDQWYAEVTREASELAVYDDYTSAVAYARENSDRFKMFLNAMQNYVPTSYYPDIANGSRCKVIYYRTPAELLIQINYLWNVAIGMKKANRNLWLYVDDIDEFMYSQTSSDYLIALLDKCKRIKVPFTMVIQNAAKICANDAAQIEFDYLLEKIDYFKLMSLGVIERRKLVEKLSIPNSLVTYLTDREPSEGIIITPTANISFNDRFESATNDFYNCI